MIEWKTSTKLIPLEFAVKKMEQRVLDIHNGVKNELIWMLEHTHVYSGGTSSNNSHLLNSPKIPVQLTGRGGSYTYHGPGQRVIYIMLDLKGREKDVRSLVWNIEQWIIDTLGDFGISGTRQENRVGVWVCTKIPQKQLNTSEKSALKIASIGLRLKKWISYFGASINVYPDLRYFNDIVPCGNEGYGVTSFKHQGKTISLTELDRALQQKFYLYFSDSNQHNRTISY